MKALFIGFKRYNSILNGGGLQNQRMFKTLVKRFGEAGTDSYYIHDENIKRSVINKVSAVFYFLIDYHNGLTRKKVKEIIETARNGYEYVFISTSVLGILAKELKNAGYQGKVIVHFHNIESIYYDAITPKWLPGRQVIVNCAAHNDRYACQYADSIITLSKRDSDYLFKHYGRAADVIIGIGLEDKCKDSTPRDAMTGNVPECLFLGSYFQPNNEGILWFVHNVLPYVNIRLKIVGKGMKELKNREKCLENIEVLSDVPDLRPFFENADFMLFPIFSGSGMKVKTCEALMYGKNIIGTDEAFEGYDLDTDLVGKKCNTAKEFIDAINSFAQHPVRRYNNNSRSIFLEKYSDLATEAKILNLFKVDRV